MKRITFFKSLLVAAGLLTGASAWATEANLNPVGVFTWTNAPAITYDAYATSWTINQGGISGGRIGRYTGPYAIVKFDASSILAGKTLLTATLDFDVTAGAYNSSINIAQMSDATFTPSTVTTATFDASATQFQAGDWSTKNSTVHFSYDVKARVEAANVLAFAIYTNTVREQTLKNVQLKLNYSDAPVAKYNYTLKAVTAGGTEIATLAEGEEYETSDVTLYFPYMFYNEGTLYTTTTTPYSVTVDKDNVSKTVTYAEANSNIVAYKEGESASANSGVDAARSNGKTGYSAGNTTATIATLPAGKYRATIYLVGNPNRACVIRNTANGDVNTNVIVSLPISKTSAAGNYTSDEFILAEETTIGFSGYTTGSKTNQSADIDYIYITKTGDLPATQEIAIPEGTGTFVSAYNLDFTGSSIKAYTATAQDGASVTFTAQTGKVPAGTPILVMGSTGNVNVTTDAVASLGTNFLVAGPGAAVASEADAKFNFILNKVGGVVGFYKAAGQTVAKDRAYLSLATDPTADAGARLDLIFSDDETTGISSISNEQSAMNSVFDLQGRRVAQPTKGLYIVNGKKVLVK